MKSPSRRIASIAQLLSTSILNIIRLIQGLILVPLYLKYVGENLYGAWLATGSIVTYLGMLDFGLNGVLVQKIGRAYGSRNQREIQEFIGCGLVVSIILSLLPLVFAFPIAHILPHIVPVSSHEISILRKSFLIAAFATSATLAMYAFAGVVNALQRQIWGGGILIIAAMLDIIVCVTMLTSGYGLYSLSFGSLAFALFSLIGQLGILLLLFRQGVVPHPIFSLKMLYHLIFPSLWMFFAKGSTIIATRSDNLIIGTIMSSRSVVVYSITKKAVELSIMIVGHFTRAFTPSLAHFFGEYHNNPILAWPIVKSILLFSGGIAIAVMNAYICFNEQFVTLWVGHSFFGGNITTIILGIYGILFIFYSTMANVVFAAGKIKITSIAAIVEAIIRFGIAFLLCRYIGISGVALAAFIAILFPLILLVLPFSASLLIEVKKVLYLFSSIIRLLIYGAVASISVFLFPENSTWSVFLIKNVLFLSLFSICIIIFEIKTLKNMIQIIKGVAI